MAEYAATYGGLPRPDTPWPLFLALVGRCPRFDSRERLRLLDSVTGAIAAAFGEGTGADLHRDELVRGAYPLIRRAPAMALIQSGARP